MHVSIVGKYSDLRGIAVSKSCALGGDHLIYGMDDEDYDNNGLICELWHDKHLIKSQKSTCKCLLISR